MKQGFRSLIVFSIGIFNQGPVSLKFCHFDTRASEQSFSRQSTLLLSPRETMMAIRPVSSMVFDIQDTQEEDELELSCVQSAVQRTQQLVREASDSVSQVGVHFTALPSISASRTCLT